VAVSLVLHALLLFALPLIKEAKLQIPAKLTARLAPKPPEPVPPKAEPPPPQVRPAPIPPVARPAPVAKAVAPAAAVSPPILSVEPAKQASEPVFVVPAAPSTPMSPDSSPSSATAARLEAQPASSGLDAGTVARFRLELMDVARRYKRYPRIAQDNNWEGRVELRIVIGEDGAISTLTVKKGAGRAVLDDEAQAMIRTAKSKVTIPPALRGKSFVLEIPVDFFLKEER
jgi:protein TonB